MKVSTTLERIEQRQGEQLKATLNEKEEKQTKKEYLQTLEQLIEEKIYCLYNISANYEITSDYIILYSDDIINDIIEEVREESDRQTIEKEFYSIENQDNWSSKKELIYKWDNFLIEKDVHDLYFKICERIKKEYAKKTEIQEKRLIQLLKNNIRSVFNNYGYLNAINFFENEEMKNTICYELAKNKIDYNFLSQNYYICLNSVKKEYKKETPEKINTQATSNRTKKEEYKTIIQRHPVATLGGFAIAGVVKGFKNAIK